MAIGANYATNGSTPRTQILVACALGMGIAIVTILLAARNAPKASTEANEDKRVDKNMAQTPVDLSVVAYDAGGSIADHDENDHNGIELGAVAPAAGERRSAASQSDDRSNGSALDRCYIVFLALFAILIPVGMRELQRAWPVRPTIDAPSPITYAPTEAGNDAATNSSATSSPTLSPSLSPTEGKNLAFDVEEARETVLGLRTALEDYWRGNTALLHSVYLKPSDPRYVEGIDFIANKMARAMVHGDKFVVSTMGSSVVAAHDACNADSYQNQLERTMASAWKAVGCSLKLEMLGRVVDAATIIVTSHFACAILLATTLILSTTHGHTLRRVKMMRQQCARRFFGGLC